MARPTHLAVTLDAQGAIRQATIQRWGNPEGGDYHYETFGIIAEASDTSTATPFLPKFGRGGSWAPSALSPRASSSAALLIEPATADQNFSTARGIPVDNASLLKNLVRYGTLTGSSHNTQYWRFRVDENALLCLVDGDLPGLSVRAQRKVAGCGLSLKSLPSPQCGCDSRESVRSRLTAVSTP